MTKQRACKEWWKLTDIQRKKICKIIYHKKEVKNLKNKEIEDIFNNHKSIIDIVLEEFLQFN